MQKSRARGHDARILRSRDAILRAFVALLEERPLEAITGVMIARRADIGYATFFRHYTDVRAVLVDVVAALTDDLMGEMMPALLTADSHGAAVALVSAVAERRATFHALLSGAGDALRAELARQVIGRIEGQPDLPSPAWPLRRLATRVAVMGTIELLDWWLSEAPESDQAEVAALLDRLVIAPLAEISPA